MGLRGRCCAITITLACLVFALALLGTLAAALLAVRMQAGGGT